MLRRCAVQEHDALRIVAEADLLGGAQHPVGPLATHLPAGDLHAIGHRHAQGGKGHQVSHRHVEGAAADLQGFPVTGINVDQLDAIGVRVGTQVEHPGHHDAVQSPTDRRHRLDGQAEVAELVTDLLGGAVHGCELLEPRQEDLH